MHYCIFMTPDVEERPRKILANFAQVDIYL